ncbi:filamentous hemagglutinin N-terminal domain-containing protein, partial [Salmonella enterica subsp. enterica serovar Ngili]|nr:filamentous hemagglutinin N-terminal domain-containing protein [Salmonella enterica subsp. enterica serovar Ngili]
MNKIYKLKFDKRRNELVVVSEITAGMGKEKSTGHIAGLSGLSPFVRLLGKLTPLSLLTGLVTGLLPMMVMAADLPTGGQIVAGQGSISTAGNQMTVHQQTQNMATNWQGFDIGQNNSVQFIQPDSSAVALNRVTGGSASQIMGSLTANGKVFLINPNGVLFGKNARVDTGGFVASTKNMNTADFMQGNYTLSGGSVSGAEIVNQGALTTTKGGFIVLAADRVRNSGTITTPSGKAVLAAADNITLKLDNSGLTSVSVNGSVVNALVENSGLVSATNGQVYLTAKGQNMLLNTVVNNSGTIEAKGLSAEGGVIRLDGGDSGVVSQSGMLLADSDTGRGGKITVEGQNIHLAAGSKTSATGKTGGGSVLAGGGWQGKDATIRNASKVVMDKNAVIDVSATSTGQGGTAVLWSDDYTSFRGTILAKGGAQSGNGGQVETSSHNNLQAFGDVDASAANGKGGNWLLDPTDVTIVGTGGDNNITASVTDSTGIFAPTADGAQILNSSIESQLNNGTSVTVTTSGVDAADQSGNITVNANVVKTAGADASLTLKADNNISTADKITVGSTGGKLDLNLLAGNTSQNAGIRLGNNINISLNGGDFYAGSASGNSAVSLVFSNNGFIRANDILMNLSGGLSGYAYAVLADNNLTINNPVSGTTGWAVPLRFIAGNYLTINTTGAINLRASDTTNGGGSVVLSGTNGIGLNAGGDINLIAADVATNSVTVNSSNGAVSMNASGISLQKATVSAGNNITLDAKAQAAGSNYAVVLNNVNMTSTNGNIVINGNHTGGGVTGGVILTNTKLTTSQGNISITGKSGSTSTYSGAGIMMNGGNTLTANSQINMYGERSAVTVGGGYDTTRFSGMTWKGNNNLRAANMVVWGRALNDLGAAMQFGDNGGGQRNGGYIANVTFDGDVSLIGEGGRQGILFTNNYYNNTSNILTFNNGRVDINVTGSTAFGGSRNIGYISKMILVVSNASLNINAENNYGTGNNAFGGDGFTDITIRGNGSVNINGTSNDNGIGVNMSAVNIRGLNGSLNISGQSEGGAGVILGNNKDYTGVNITGSANNSGSGVVIGTNTTVSGGNISGTSNSGVGVLTSANSEVSNSNVSGSSNTSNGVGINGNVSNSNVSGTSNSGNGVVANANVTISGSNVSGTSNTGNGNGVTVQNNVAISGSGINGTSNAGAGSGVIINGNTHNFTDTDITGQAAGTGNGVTAGGVSGSNVTLNGAATGSGHGVAVNNTTVSGSDIMVNGTAAGAGNGVVVNNSTTSGVDILGNASSGSGIQVNGNSGFNDSTLTGNSGSGAGLNITGNTITDADSVLTGNSDSNSGVIINGSLSGAIVNGNSNTSSGVTVGNSDLVSVVVGGTSNSGAGVDITGNTTISDGSIITGNSAAPEGNGVVTGDNITNDGEIRGDNPKVNSTITGNGTFSGEANP